MSSWYSNVLTTTTSRISNFRTAILGGDADGDTEDDTHVCRVLRAYYTEKGRQFPQWLPPDPKAPPPTPPVYAQPQVGSRYGGLSQATGSQSSGLSSLWDSKPAGSQSQDQQSLRAGRGVPPGSAGGAGGASRLSPFARHSAGTGREDVQTRPLPSQRSGSYQSNSSYNSSGPPSSGGGGGSGRGGTAQDRLRNRLLGGGGARTASPQGQSPFPPPTAQHSSGGYGGGYGGGGGGGGSNYEDRFAPGGMYDGGGQSRGNDRPYVSANSPWASGPGDYGDGGGISNGGRAGGGSGRRMGLPSGPRMR